MKTFASDNYSGVHPEIFEALQKANAGHAGSYGNDDFTRRAVQKFKDLFGQQAEVFFVYNGTGANVLGLTALTRSYHSVLCAAGAHINVDESTAPEKFTGCKLVTISTDDGKLYPDQIAAKIQRVGDPHHPQAKVIAISQATEYGTVYSVDEIKAISELARKHNFYLHMDGSRIANAAVHLGKDFRSFTADAGVDILSFGGTKNGMMFGEAIVIFNPALAGDFVYLRKQAMQLHSKMRFISAQFEALLSNDLWQRNARHTNTMAKLLAEEVGNIPGVKITQQVQANGVFAILPPAVIPRLQEKSFFYTWNEAINEVRWMCAWDTTEEEVKTFARELRRLL